MGLLSLIKNFRAPALPLATKDYNEQATNQMANILRLYFNQIDQLLGQIVATIIPSGTEDDPLYVGTYDSRGRLHVTTPQATFFNTFQYGIETDVWDTGTVSGGTATFEPDTSSVRMAVTSTVNSECIRQTLNVQRYIPGRPSSLAFSIRLQTPVVGVRRRFGLFDGDNGFFFEDDGGVYSCVIVSNASGSTVYNRVTRANWNGDKLDGTGLSGRVLDVTKTQILAIDFEWLGVGDVRCGFFEDGKFVVCHTFHNDNIQTTVYMTTAILPVRYEIESVAAIASGTTMKQICSTVISEGGYEQKSALTWARRTAVLAATTTFKPLVSIQLKSTALGAVVLPSIFNALPIGSVLDYEVALIKNPTLTGASFTSNSTNVEYDVTATALTGGTITDLTYVSGSNQGSGTGTGSIEYNFDLQLGVSLGGTSDIYTLAARTISGSDDIIGSLSYYDLTD